VLYTETKDLSSNPKDETFCSYKLNWKRIIGKNPTASLD